MIGTCVPFIHRQGDYEKFNISSIQNIIIALRMLAYNIIANFMDEYLWVEEITILRSLKFVVVAVISIFIESYLRKFMIMTLLDYLRFAKNMVFHVC